MLYYCVVVLDGSVVILGGFLIVEVICGMIIFILDVAVVGLGLKVFLMVICNNLIVEMSS